MVGLVRVIVWVGLIASSATVEASEVTLCNPHEEIYFSCRSDGKILSVCAAGNISPDNGYVQYRFGRTGKIELEYPDMPYTPRKWFSINGIPRKNVVFNNLKFTIGDYHYVLYEGIPSGLHVIKNGKIVSNRICDFGIYDRMSNRASRGIATGKSKIVTNNK